jgi:hypothetical protein
MPVILLAAFFTLASTFLFEQSANCGVAPENIDIVYQKPNNPEHVRIYQTLKDAHILEAFRQVLKLYDLHKSLTLQLKGCDGADNAWYDENNSTVTVCYEYLAHVARDAPTETTPAGVTPKDAVIGPTTEIFLHEIAHALFDILKIPILGNEEDAADMVAAYTLLQFGPTFARSAIGGVAYMYKHDKDDKPLTAERLSDQHPLPEQRFYNLLCLAYGDDPKTFGYVVDQGFLPEDRAIGCAYEYDQVDYAVRNLLEAHIDEVQRKKVYARLKGKLSGDTLNPLIKRKTDSGQ